jgi:hypothetical protein
MSDRCDTCGEWKLFSTHTCHPAWKIWCIDHDETEDEAVTIYAYDADAAVEKWAEETDCYGDYAIVQGDTPTVAVRRAEQREAPITYHCVSGESVPQYHAQEMKLDDFKRELERLVQRGSMRSAGKLYGQMLTLDFPPQPGDRP